MKLETRNSKPVATFAAALLALCGCGYQGGVLLSVLGAGQMHKVEAEYKLSDGPVLVLVDDLEERLTWPDARELLTEETTKLLIEHKATKKIISPETVARFRRGTPQFETRGAREIGRMVEADQVVWLEVKAFIAQEEMQDTSQAAILTVTVKVIDPNAEERSQVRLWPTVPEGRPVTTQLNSSDVVRLKTLPNIGRELCEKTAKEVAKLFYKHPIEDPDE